MKRNRLFPSAAAATAVLGCFGIVACWVGSTARAEKLSNAELEQLQEKLTQLKKKIDDRFFQLNSSAGDVFLNASQDPAEAVALYFKCVREVNYVREARDDKEFEEWKDGQRDRVKDPRFLEGLQTQLRYLALSCKAAEAEDLETIFPGLLSYGDGLMRLTEMPSQALLQDVSGSIFAKAYQVQKLLQKNADWEMVPLNIGGIYEKTVLPYLRNNEPEKLMGAWDRRIAQQTRMVEFFESMENRGNRRDDRRRSENEVRAAQGGRGGNIIKAHDQDDFIRDTLPELQLGKLIDMFLHIDQAQGAAGLMAFIESQVEHEKAEDWLNRISDILASEVSSSPPPPPPAPPVTTTTTTGPATPPSPGVGTTTSGKVPPGLVPAD